MKNHFLMSYFGNKRMEVENFYNSIKDNLNDIDTIIEPFCGSSALSYYISLQHPLKFKYILNDNDKYLIELYKIVIDEKKFNEFILKLNKISENINKEKYDKLKKEDTLVNWFYVHKIYSIRTGLYPLNAESKIIKDFNILKNCPIINFLKTEKIEIVQGDGMICYKKYKDLENNLIILDPPYLSLCNDFYYKTDVNLYEYLYDNNIKNEKAKIYLILENIWIIKLLFKNNNILSTYSKKYQTTKKQTEHIIIYNKI